MEISLENFNQKFNSAKNMMLNKMKTLWAKIFSENNSTKMMNQ
jgi:hypothetical protein